jgi:hypothetical protein
LLFDLAKPVCGFHPENHNREGGRGTGAARRRLQDWTMSEDVAGPNKNQGWGFTHIHHGPPSQIWRFDHCQRPPQPPARSMSTRPTTTAAPNDQDHLPEDHRNQIWLLHITGQPSRTSIHVEPPPSGSIHQPPSGQGPTRALRSQRHCPPPWGRGMPMDRGPPPRRPGGARVELPC